MMTVPFRTKVILLAIGPLLLALALVSGRMVQDAERLERDQGRALREQLLTSKREELRNHVRMASSALAPVRSVGDDREARRVAKDLLGAMRYGEDGYLFVYDTQGACLVHTAMPELVGLDLRTLEERAGPVRALLGVAARGGGFHEYLWTKPSSGREELKLSYVETVQPWGWVVGTGAYLDDLDRAVQASRERASQAIRRTLWAMTAVALLAIGLVFAGALTLSVSERRVADSQLESLTQRIVALQEEERAFVARELHDGLSQRLVGAKFQFEAVRSLLPAAAHASWEEGLRQLTIGLAEIRAMSHRMRPPELDELGLGAALRQHVESFARQSGLETQFKIAGKVTEPNPEQRVALFRVAQEALANVARHANAKRVLVQLEFAMGLACLSIEDDGSGFDPKRGQDGIGLKNMRGRIDHLDGEFFVKTSNRGTVVRAIVPLVRVGVE